MLPNREGTYRQGASLDLYAWQPPDPPAEPRPMYKKPPVSTRRAERYHKSVAERVTLPPTPPTVSITLDKRLSSSLHRVSHVWTSCVQGSSSAFPPQLVAKIYDPVFFDDDETCWSDPFVLRDFVVSSEVEAYRRLEPIQGTKVPRFYGYFYTALPDQDGRTVCIILLERVPGMDLRAIVPRDAAENVCNKHKNAILDSTLHLLFVVLACGVLQIDMHPENVVLQPQKHASPSVSGAQFCDTKHCMLAFVMDCDDLRMVMVDFELVDFREPDPSLREQDERRIHIEKIKSAYLSGWLEGMAI